MIRLLFLGLIFLPPVYADKLSDLNHTLNNKLDNPALLEQALKQGSERASVCKYCHGKTGNSRRGYIPNLAAQNPKYLLHQFELFASGQRKDKIMSELANNLSADDRINIALYYASQKIKPKPAEASATSQKGENIFHARCASCHGINGYGKELLPRIASQPGRYLKKTLRAYQTNSRKRPNSPMQEIAAGLKKDELDAVVEFISAMQ